MGEKQTQRERKEETNGGLEKTLLQKDGCE